MTIRTNGNYAQLVFPLDGLLGEHQFQQVGDGPRWISPLPHGFHNGKGCTISDHQFTCPGDRRRPIPGVNVQTCSGNRRVTHPPGCFPRHPTGGADTGQALIVLGQDANGVVSAFGAVQPPQS